jgi:hypothetical protein
MAKKVQGGRKNFFERAPRALVNEGLRRGSRCRPGLDKIASAANFSALGATPLIQRKNTTTVRRKTMMLDENLARLRAHRSNIHRYRRLLATRLTELERGYIEKRLNEELASLEELSATTFLFSLPMRRQAAANHADLGVSS